MRSELIHGPGRQFPPPIALGSVEAEYPLSVSSARPQSRSSFPFWNRHLRLPAHPDAALAVGGALAPEPELQLPLKYRETTEAGVNANLVSTFAPGCALRCKA